LKNLFPITTLRLLALLLVIGLISTSSPADAATTPWTTYKTVTDATLYSATTSEKRALITIPAGTIIRSDYLSAAGTYRRTSYGGKTGYVLLSKLSEYYVNQSIKGVRYQLTEDVVAKSGANAKSTTLKTLKSGNIYYTTLVVTDPYGGKWHRMSLDGKAAYVTAGKGMLVSYQSISDYSMKAVANTPLRFYAGISYATRVTIPQGTVLSASGKLGDWYKVSYAGNNGYVAASSLASNMITKQTVGTRYVLSTSVDVKTQAVSTAATIKRLASGNVYYTTQTVTDGHGKTWHRMKVDGKTGYVPAGLGSKISYTSLSGKVFKATSNTPLRTYAGSSYAAVATIPSGTSVSPAGKIGNWYKVSYGDKSGYAYGGTLQEVTIVTTTIPGARYATSVATPLLSKVDGTGTVLMTLPAGNTVYTTKLVTAGGKKYIYVKINGKTGYLPLETLSPIAYTATASTNYQPYAGKTATLRAYAGPDHDALVTIPENTRVTSSGRIGDWLQVSYGGQNGYVKASELELAKTTYFPETGRYYVGTDPALPRAPAWSNRPPDGPKRNP